MPVAHFPRRACRGYLCAWRTDAFARLFRAGSGTACRRRSALFADAARQHAPDDEEGRAQFDALAEVIQGVSLAGGMGRLDDGYRVELGGAYTAPSGDNVYVTGAANLTADGLSLESNLIEGERLSIRWETLLEMLGLSENEIDALLSCPPRIGTAR
ncbi:MAG: hypothetical protein ACLR4A_18645 [Christensenellales bacterium]